VVLESALPIIWKGEGRKVGKDRMKDDVNIEAPAHSQNKVAYLLGTTSSQISRDATVTKNGRHRDFEILNFSTNSPVYFDSYINTVPYTKPCHTWCTRAARRDGTWSLYPIGTKDMTTFQLKPTLPYKTETFCLPRGS
jgi:hypothetical protein